jgi:hypothetical protein
MTWVSGGYSFDEVHSVAACPWDYSMFVFMCDRRVRFDPFDRAVLMLLSRCVLRKAVRRTSGDPSSALSFSPPLSAPTKVTLNKWVELVRRLLFAFWDCVYFWVENSRARVIISPLSTTVHCGLRITYGSSTNTTKAIIITSAYKVLYNNKREISLDRCRR